MAWVRFECPACKQTHMIDIPETRIPLHMTCGQTGIAMEIRLTKSFEVKVSVVEANAEGK